MWQTLLKLVVKNQPVILIFYTKIFYKNTKLRKHKLYTNLYHKHNSVLFLRSPKHFKNGKQVLKKKTTTYISNFYIKNVKNDIFINNSINHLEYFRDIFIKNLITSGEIYKLTISYKMFLIIHDWCFIFTYNN